MKTGKQLLTTALVLCLQGQALATDKVTAKTLVGEGNIDQAMSDAMSKVEQGKADSKKVSGDYGGGNGGDGVFMYAKDVPEVSNINWGNTLAGWEKKLEGVFEDEKLRIFSMDLAEYGLEKTAYVDFASEIEKHDEIACVETYGCFAIKNTELFKELMDYGGFFGKELDFDGNFNVSYLYNAYDELADIYDSHKKVSEDYSDLYWKGVFDDEDKRTDAEEKEMNSLEAKMADLKKTYIDSLLSHFKDKQIRIVDSNGIFAIGVINKLEQIRAENEALYQKLKKTLIDLDWMVVNRPLVEIEDEGKLGAKYEGKVQLATREYGVVRITKLGWYETFKRNGEWVSPMNITNRLAVIFHEVNYEITANQGEDNSESARLATAMLFKDTRKARSIKKASEILLK